MANVKHRLSPYYLNTRRLSAVSGYDIPVAAQAPLRPNSGERAQAMRLASQVADSVLTSGKVPILTRELIRGIEEGELVTASTWGVFIFKGVSAALRAQEAGKPFKPATFSGTITIGDTEFALSGELSNDHLYSDTSIGLLSGKRRVLIYGQFAVEDGSIQVFPFVIGDLVEEMGFLPISWRSAARLYPEQIESFSKVEGTPLPKAAEVRSLRQIPEDVVKRAFADIVGEPFVPKDWGGEKSDLQTSQLRIGGERVSAAFIFKGPAVAGPMHPGNMGKRGDQLPRAFDEPADVIVIQHCDKIENTVVRIAEALATDPARTRRYCILDGSDTYRILKAYGKLPKAEDVSATAKAATPATDELEQQ